MGMNLLSKDLLDDISSEQLPGLNVNYDSENEDHKADVYFLSTKARKASPSRPGVIIVPENGADKMDYKYLALTARDDWGYVAMVINQENTRDVLTAVKYLRAHAEDYGMDESRIAVLGFKSGGKKALKAALKGKRKAAIQLAIVVDAGKVLDNLVLLAHEGASPTLFLQASTEVSAIAQALKDNGVDVEISDKAGSEHENKIMSSFLHEYLGRGSPPGTSTTTSTTSASSNSGSGCKPCSGTAGDGCDSVEGELRLTQLNDDSAGLLEIFRNGEWYGMCGDTFSFDDFFDDDRFDTTGNAKVACRQLGFSDGGAWWFNQNTPGVDGPSFNPNFRCNGTEERLTDCMVGPDSGECSYTTRLSCFDGCPSTGTMTTTPVNFCTGSGDATRMTCDDIEEVNLLGLGNAVPKWETGCDGKHFRNWASITGTGDVMKYAVCSQRQFLAITLASCDGEELVEEDCSDEYYAFDFYYECGVYGIGVVFDSEAGKQYFGGVGVSFVDPRQDFDEFVEVFCGAGFDR